MVPVSILKPFWACLLILAPVFSWSQIETKKISFAAGKNDTNVSGTIKGQQTIDYTVQARGGQKMTVVLTTKHTALYFNVLPPGSNDAAIFIGSTEGNEYRATLPSDGLYKIRVYLMRSAARRNESGSYKLYVGVTDQEK